MAVGTARLHFRAVVELAVVGLATSVVRLCVADRMCASDPAHSVKGALGRQPRASHEEA